MKKKETLKFQSEVKRLLDILVYSLYKNREIFLRELISNAVDALNKVQFELLTDKKIEDRERELRIDIKTDKEKNMLIVEDTGIGMTRKELIDNLGTIAHSGTMDFLKKVQRKKKVEDLDLIGKFGVGFYSVFMVAKEVRILTKSFRKGSSAYLWVSQGGEEYTIEKSEKDKRGTRIEIILKEDAKEFLEEYRIENIINKHSKFVPFPIYINGKELKRKPPIWTQPKNQLKEKDYFEFYKYLTNYEEKPLTYLHISADAPYQFHALIYVPDISTDFMELFTKEPGVDLYSKKVLIRKHSKDIIPEYLNFLKGVVDSEDLPLNISRESIQDDLIVQKIKKHIVKKILEHLKNIKEKDFELYVKIWKKFGRKFKEGIISDFDNRDLLSELLLFESLKSGEGKFIDLNKYKESFEKDQTEIYYISGESYKSIEKNPSLEIFKEKGIDVLFLTDPVDEFVLEHLKVFKSFPFKAVESSDIKIGEEKREEDRELKDFIDFLKNLYGDRVADVRVSRRLTKSACTLVNPENSPSVQMERIMKIMNKDYEMSKKIFEINPNNILIKKMISLYKKDKDSDKLKNIALHLLENQMIREGLISDLNNYLERSEKIMLETL